MGVTTEQLITALNKEGFTFTSKDYNDDGEEKSSEIWLDLERIEEDDGPGGIDY